MLHSPTAAAHAAAARRRPTAAAHAAAARAAQCLPPTPTVLPAHSAAAAHILSFGRSPSQPLPNPTAAASAAPAAP